MLIPVNATIDVLKAEAKRLRSLADRIESFAAEIAGTPQGEVGAMPPGRANGIVSPSASAPRPVNQEYRGMTQGNAILKALQYGPQTTRELWERLNFGGMEFKKVVYVTAVLARLKDQIERLDGGKIKLKADVNQSLPFSG